METMPEPPTSVGQQLKRRREELDLTQGALAGYLGITVTSVSAAENDRSAIRRSKRSVWEQALRLKPGTITRAYTTGSPVEPLDESPAASPAASPYADMSDRHERAIWEMERLSEEDRRAMIDILRSDRSGEHRRSA